MKNTNDQITNLVNIENPIKIEKINPLDIIKNIQHMITSKRFLMGKLITFII